MEYSMDEEIIIKNRWWKRPLCWLTGGCDVTPYDYADNGWLFCSRCGKERTLIDLHRSEGYCPPWCRNNGMCVKQ